MIDIRSADDIDGVAGEEELAKLVEQLNKAPHPTAWRSVPRRQADDKQHQRHQQIDQSKQTLA